MLISGKALRWEDLSIKLVDLDPELLHSIIAALEENNGHPKRENHP